MSTSTVDVDASTERSRLPRRPVDDVLQSSKTCRRSGTRRSSSRVEEAERASMVLSPSRSTAQTDCDRLSARRAVVLVPVAPISPSSRGARSCRCPRERDVDRDDVAVRSTSMEKRKLGTPRCARRSPGSSAVSTSMMPLPSTSRRSRRPRPGCPSPAVVKVGNAVRLLLHIVILLSAFSAPTPSIWSALMSVASTATGVAGRFRVDDVCRERRSAHRRCVPGCRCRSVPPRLRADDDVDAAQAGRCSTVTTGADGERRRAARLTGRRIGNPRCTRTTNAPSYVRNHVPSVKLASTHVFPVEQLESSEHEAPLLEHPAFPSFSTSTEVGRCDVSDGRETSTGSRRLMRRTSTKGPENLSSARSVPGDLVVVVRRREHVDVAVVVDVDREDVFVAPPRGSSVITSLVKSS